MSKSILSLVIAAFAFLSISVPAAANTVTFTGGLFSPEGAAVNTDFESGIPPNWVFNGSSIDQGSIAGESVEPYQDSTHYASVAAGGSITASFPSPISYLGLYWGSPDSYNVIVFTDTDGVQTTYVAGTSPLVEQTPNGLPVLSQYVNFFDTGAPWVSVTFESQFDSFEFDNVATLAAQAIPEPSSVGLTLLAMLALGTRFRRRNR